MRIGRVLLDWGCPAVISTGPICCVLSVCCTLCLVLGMEAGPGRHSISLLELAGHGWGGAARNHITSYVIKPLQVVTSAVKEANRQRQRNRS